MPISRPFGRWFVAASLLLIGLLAGLSGANAQGRRLGLVVGLADYGETRHPTALQDASLVAQALKQAGFELAEGANLSQNELRAMLRDFADKVGAAGPDALIAVYVAGVGVQEDGENILIPAGARLRQKSDLGIEGLRIDDMLRVVGSMPASARIVMLDAAYAHPYAQLVADGGRGLAPVEKREGMLVAYNHSPNQTVELPRTNYGAYAMALAEVLAEPGLELSTIFNRVRLRVHDQTQGLQTPWDVNGLNRPIVLVAPAPGAAPVPAPAPRRPIAELGADEAYGRAVEIDTIKSYEEFLRAYPDHPQAKRVRAMIASRREAYYWQRARRANTSRAYWTYLRRYPNGAHAGEAEARLARLSAPVEPPVDFEEIIYDDLPPPPPVEVEIYETVVVEDNWSVLPPPPGFGIIGLPPPPLAIIDLPPPPPPVPSQKILPAVAIGAGVIGAAILANRMWKRPATVRPPVAPPIVRPVRPIQPVGVGPRPGPGQIMPVGPGVGQPPAVGPRPGPGQIMPGGGVIRPGQPPAVSPVRPGVAGQPPITAPGQPTVVRPGQPPVVTPGRPGVVGQPPVAPPGQPTVVRPGQPPVVTPGRPGVVGQPPVTPPGQPNVVRPGQPPVVTPVRPGIGAPSPGPGGRQRPVITPQRPAPPVARPAPPAVRPVAPVARPAPVHRPPRPVVRQPAPVVRQAPPVVRQPPPRPAPAYRPPPPVGRAAPPPAVRPAAPVARPPAPAPRPCTPQMRAARQC